MAISGTCHCGAMQFACSTDPQQVTTCNCSICRRRGAVLHFADGSEVSLKADPETTGIYRFNRHIIAHHFCKICGVAPWSQVQMPDGTVKIALNLRASDVDYAGLPVQEFDGAAI